MEKIIATVLKEAHERQAEEAMGRPRGEAGGLLQEQLKGLSRERPA